MTATPTHPHAPRYMIGCMTGTSLDGLDAALVRLDGVGRGVSAQFVAVHSVSFPAALRATLLAMAGDEPVRTSRILAAARALGELHVAACRPLLERAGAAVDLVVAHGQTVCHSPATAGGSSRGVSWQLLDPWPIARDLGVRVCYDLRQADLIAGGEGAPITPIADPILYPLDDAAAVNLGGICNVTRWRLSGGGEPPAITGGDIGPCNLVLDGLASRLFPGDAYDAEGGHAIAGTARDEAVSVIAGMVDAACDRRSLGREQFGGSFIDEVVHRNHGVEAEDLLAAAVEAIASRIAAHLSADPPRTAVLAGGGARHPLLARRIAAHAEGIDVRLSSDFGVPLEAREAAAMAVLGALSWDGVPITLADITGGDRPGIAGSWVSPQRGADRA